MRTFLVFLITVTCAVVAALALEPTRCDATTRCPHSSPCCSKQGLCGTTSEYCSPDNCNAEASFAPISCTIGSGVSGVTGGGTSGGTSGGTTRVASVDDASDGTPSGSGGTTKPKKPLCKTYRETFDKTPRVVLYDDWDKTDKQADWVNMANDAKQFSVSNGTLKMYLRKPDPPYGKIGGNLGNGMTLSTTRLMQYGTVEASVKMAAPGGVVTAFITYSDVQHDEIDFEWVGKNHQQVQSNYYVDNIADYSKGQFHSMATDLSAGFHRYTIDWTPDRILWKVDGQIVRTLNKKDTCQNGQCKFPDEASRVQLGIWDASANKNLADWSGGPVQWDKLPDVVITEVDWVDIRCNPNFNALV